MQQNVKVWKDLGVSRKTTKMTKSGLVFFTIILKASLIIKKLILFPLNWTVNVLSFFMKIADTLIIEELTLLLKELVHFDGDTHRVQQTNGQEKRNQSGFTKTYRNGCNLCARSIALALQICLHIFWCNFKCSHWNNNKHSSLNQCKFPFDFEATFKINGNAKKQERLTLGCFRSESGALPFYSLLTVLWL